MADILIMRTLIDLFTTIISMISIILIGLIPSFFLTDSFETKQYLSHIEQSAALHFDAELKIALPENIKDIRFDPDKIVAQLEDSTIVEHELVKTNLIKNSFYEEETNKIVIIT